MTIFAVIIGIVFVCAAIISILELKRQTPRLREEARERAEAKSYSPAMIAEIESRRPTVTRVGLGLMLGGIPGGLLGFAFRKKTKTKIKVG